MNSNRDWEIVKDFYVTTFSVPEELVDLVASSDVLLMCVSGACNESISNTLSIDVDIVGEILSTVLDFDGWDEDLNLNPYFVYNSMKSSTGFGVDSFIHDVSITNKEYTTSQIETMYRVCSIFSQIEGRIEKDWT